MYFLSENRILVPRSSLKHLPHQKESSRSNRDKNLLWQANADTCVLSCRLFVWFIRFLIKFYHIVKGTTELNRSLRPANIGYRILGIAYSCCMHINLRVISLRLSSVRLVLHRPFRIVSALRSCYAFFSL